MRSPLTTLMAAAIAVLVAACASATPNDAPAADEPVTRTISHAYGQAETPTDPERVVVLNGTNVLGAVLQSDVPIVGYTRQPAGAGIAPFFDESKLADAQDVGWVNALNIEAIAATDPDVIIGTTGFVADEAMHATLSEIAPTIAFESFGTTPWRDTLRQVAEVLGNEEQVEAGIAEYEARIDDVRTRLGERAGPMTVTLANFRALDDIRNYPPNWCSGTTLADVGLVFAEEERENTGDGVSVELIAGFDADAIFYFVGSSTVDTDAREATTAIQQNPLWDTLGAVQREQAFDVDKAHWFGCGSLQAQNLVLDDVERLLLGEG